MTDRLPIYDIEEAIIASLRSERRLILSAPTGSGKSTQVPQMLLKHGLLDAPAGQTGQVVVLQPRRLATRLLAARVAEELGVALGREVGYQIRFESVTSKATRIRFVTEGVLLRQMLDDDSLPGVQALIFDEFHERHLYGDITLARALDIQETKRPDLLIIVMSATIEAAELKRYLGERRAHGAPSSRSASSANRDQAVAQEPNPASDAQRVGVPARATTDRTERELGAPAATGRQECRPSGCAVLESSGRTFPVDVHFAARPSYENRSPVWEQAADAFAHFVGSGGEGDVLVFMPGAYEIHRTIEAIKQTREAKGFLVLPLHGELQPRDQDAAVARYQQRKVVIATNVAETSLTIDGIRLVIDSGLARIPRFDPYRGINTLLIEKISRASADQRTGRAGRTAPGVCYRLWSEVEHQDRPAQEKPEVQRLDLAEVVLTLKAAGVEDLHSFRWLEHPGDQRLAHAEELLLDLGALERRAGITPLGRRMLKFPLHPRYSRMLLAAEELGCVYQACLIAALTQGRDLLIRRTDKHAGDKRDDVLGDRAASDFFLLMRAWRYAEENGFQLEACQKLGIHAMTARQVGPLLQQFLRTAEREGLDVTPREVKDEVLQKCLLIGFSDRVARRLDGGTLRCELVHGRRGELARESVARKHPLLVVAEVREVGRHGGDTNTILSLATAIEPAWLEEFFPSDLGRALKVTFDPTTKRVYAKELRQFRGLELDARVVEPPPLDQSALLLADEVVASRLKLNDWDDAVEQWITRLNLLAKWCPEFELPTIGDDDRRTLIEQVCHGAFTYREIKDRPVKHAVKEWLNPMQRQLLDEHAPERLKLSNGKTPKVIYSATEPPHTRLRIQELFDVTTTPKIAMGREPVLLHILAPNMRPVQITQDLAGFWREHYPRVKSELQRRYPKHQWR